MPGQSSSRPASSIVDATIVSRGPSVLTAEVDGEIVMMSIKQGRYFGLDDIGSDIWKRAISGSGLSVTARTKYPNSPPHTSTSVYCLRIWLNRAFTAAGASGWLLFTKPIT
jgi:hypothetical protein